MKKTILWIIVCLVGVAAFGGIIFLVKTDRTPYSNEPKVIVGSPVKNSIISSPLAVSGKARGSWFFEGSFPIILKDAYGTILAEGHVTAQGAWTTADFISFAGTLQYNKQIPDAKGVLILKKDNPSGLSENDESIEIPVIFK